MNPGAPTARPPRGPGTGRSPVRGRALAAALALAALFPALPAAPVAAAAAEAPGRWGWLGVRIRDLSEQEMEEISRRHGIREGFGALVVEVMKDTPAEGAGMRAGDLVVDIRGRPIVDTRALQRAVAAAPVGEVLPLVVLRSNEGRRPVRVRLGQMPDDVIATRVAMEFGFFVRDPEPQPELGGRRVSAAPVLAAVVPGSGASAAGLRAGDVLVEVAGRGVLTLDAALGALRETRLDRPLPLRVRRGGDTFAVTLDAPRP